MHRDPATAALGHAPPTSQVPAVQPVMRGHLDVLAHMACALTGKLPLNPVVAEDGHLYEREAIEKSLRRSAVSPVTKKRMGSALHPAVHVTRVFQTIIRDRPKDPRLQEWVQRKIRTWSLEKQTECVRAHMRKCRRPGCALCARIRLRVQEAREAKRAKQETKEEIKQEVKTE